MSRNVPKTNKTRPISIIGNRANSDIEEGIVPQTQVSEESFHPRSSTCPAVDEAALSSSDEGERRPSLTLRPNATVAATATRPSSCAIQEGISLDKNNKEAVCSCTHRTMEMAKKRRLELAPARPCPPPREDSEDIQICRGPCPNSERSVQGALSSPPTDRSQRGGLVPSAPGAYRVGGRRGLSDCRDSSILWNLDQASAESLGPMFSVNAELVPPDQDSVWPYSCTPRRLKLIVAAAGLVVMAVAAAAVAAVVVMTGNGDETTPGAGLSPKIVPTPPTTGAEITMPPTFPATLQGQWVQVGQTLTGKKTNDGFGGAEGVSLSANGTVLAVGSPGGNHANTNLDVGHVYVFRLEQGNEWVQVGKILQGVEERGRFGSSVSLSADGTTLAVGAHLADVGVMEKAGTATIFRLANHSTYFQEEQTLFGQAKSGQFGFSVSISGDGNTLVVGSNKYNGMNGIHSGLVHVYKFTEQGDGWIQMLAVEGKGAGEKFGSSVALSRDGTTYAAGAPYHESNFGHARVFQHDQMVDGWSELGNAINGIEKGERCGEAVSLSHNGTIAAIGCHWSSIGNNHKHAGVVRMYHWNGSGWVQVGKDIPGEAEGDESGRVVSLSSKGSTVAIGAHRNNADSGHVRVFRFESDGGFWAQVGSGIDGVAEGDLAGRAVSLSADGTILAIGSGGNDNDAADDSGHVRVFQLQD